MKFSDFLKKDFYEFPAAEGSQEKCDLKESPGLNEILQATTARKHCVKDIIKNLSSEEYKLIYVNGAAGTGKTYLLKSILSLLEKKVLTYYYECSQATNLDDIILSLFNYLKKITVKDTEYIRTFKISSSFSIDERLINRIKTLEKPLLILIDGTENIFESGDEKIRKDLLNFLDFISSVPTIKVIVAGEVFPELAEKRGVYTVKLNSLEKEEAFKLIKNTKICDSEDIIQDIFKITKGYPENILLFAAYAKNSNLNAVELMNQIESSGI